MKLERCRVWLPAVLAVALLGCKAQKVGLVEQDTNSTNGASAGTAGDAGAAGEAGASSSSGGGGAGVGGSGAGVGGTSSSGGAAGGGSSGGGSSGGASSGGASSGGASSSSGGSGGSGLDHCSDQQQNGGETDVDCGGPCDSCALDQTCMVDADCESRACAFGLCKLHLYLASQSETGQAADGVSYHPVISGDGSVIVYESSALNLFGDDANAGVVIHERPTGSMERAAVGYAGLPSHGSDAAVSEDGQVVAFQSWQTDLIENSAGVTNVFAYDRKTGKLERISQSANGDEADTFSYGASLSADGNLVMFSSDATNLPGATGFRGIYLRNRSAGTTTHISVTSTGEPANANSGRGRLSPDGQRFVFESVASNVVADDNNGVLDVFVKDLANDSVRRVSIDSDEVEGNGPSSEPAMSADGFRIAFTSEASNLVADDTNGMRDVFLRDIANGTTHRISVSSEGLEGNGHSSGPDISADGRYIVFYTTATNLAQGEDDSVTALVHDRLTGRTSRIASTIDGEWALGLNQWPRISGSGAYIVVESYERNLFFGTNITPIAAVFANPFRPI